MPLIALAMWRLWRRRQRFVWTSVDRGVLSWLTAVSVAGALYSVREGPAGVDVLHDVATTVYLTVLYFAIRILADQEFIDEAIAALVIGATLAAALGVIGFVLSERGVPNPLAFAADAAYPYLGDAARARALTATPNMLASIIMLALLLLAAGACSRLPVGVRHVAAGVLGLGFVLTVSKTVVPLAVGLVAAWRLRRGQALSRPGIAASWLAAAALFGVLSHFVFLCGDAAGQRLERAMFISGEALLRVELADRNCGLHATNYFFNKRASLIAIERSWPWGIGPGRHPAFTGQLQHEGLYPRTLWQAVPHSSYTGAAAELGLAGILGLAGSLGGVALGIRDALRRNATRALGFAAAAALAALLIEAIATDVMHFRHYTWLAALLGSAVARFRD